MKKPNQIARKGDTAAKAAQSKHATHAGNSARAKRKPAGTAEWKVVAVQDPTPAKSLCDTPAKAAQYWREHIATAPEITPGVEWMAVLVLDPKLHLRGHYLVSMGSIKKGLEHLHEIFRPVIGGGRDGIVVMHNHPDGDPSLSADDLILTTQLSVAAMLKNIRLHDHVIAGASGYFSFREHDAMGTGDAADRAGKLLVENGSEGATKASRQRVPRTLRSRAAFDRREKALRSEYGEELCILEDVRLFQKCEGAAAEYTILGTNPYLPPRKVTRAQAEAWAVNELLGTAGLPPWPCHRLIPRTEEQTCELAAFTAHLGEHLASVVHRSGCVGHLYRDITQFYRVTEWLSFYERDGRTRRNLDETLEHRGLTLAEFLKRRPRVTLHRSFFFDPLDKGEAARWWEDGDIAQADPADVLNS